MVASNNRELDSRPSYLLKYQKQAFFDAVEEDRKQQKSAQDNRTDLKSTCQGAEIRRQKSEMQIPRRNSSLNNFSINTQNKLEVPKVLKATK